MRRIDSSELKDLAFGSKIRVIWHNSNRHEKNSEYYGVIYGENIGYEDGLTDNIQTIAESIFNDWCMVYLIDDEGEEESEESNGSKFDVRICSCGRIHFTPMTEVTTAIEKDQELLLICGGCGSTYKIGADIDYFGDSNEKGYSMYCFNPALNDTDFEITKANFAATKNSKAIHKIIYSNGKRVYMKTGYYAKSFDHSNGIFMDTFYPDRMDELKNMSSEQVKEFVEKWQHDSRTVVMKAFLSNLTDDEAEALSHFHIKGLDWSGTKWDTEYN